MQNTLMYRVSKCCTQDPPLHWKPSLIHLPLTKGKVTASWKSFSFLYAWLCSRFEV